MIEVLVTLVILSVGLLGVGTLQFIASLNNVDALSRSHAVLVAEQAAERLRLSAVSVTGARGKVVDNAYVDASLYNFGNLTCTSGTSDFACFCESFPATLANCQVNKCSATQLATFDAYQLSCASILHNPNMNIDVTCVDSHASDMTSCSEGSRYTIRLSWPVQRWQSATMKNHVCNQLTSDDNDCILIELFL